MGIILSAAMIKYRERVGDMIGDPEWMHFVGGNYNFIILTAILILFWSIASLTGTEAVFFYPLRLFFTNINEDLGVSDVF